MGKIEKYQNMISNAQNIGQLKPYHVPNVSLAKADALGNHNHHLTAAVLVDVIKDVVEEEIKNIAPSYVLCEILTQKSENHYDVYVIPDRSNVIHNIINNTSFILKPGDMVYVCKIDNSFANAYIASKIIPYSNNNIWKSKSSGILRTSIKANFLTYKNGEWILTISDEFYDDIMSKYSKVRIGVSRVLCQKSSAGRAKFFPRSRMKQHPVRYHYSLPEMVGTQRMKEGEYGRYGAREFYAAPEPLKKKQWDPETGKYIYVTVPGEYRRYPIIDQVRVAETFEVPQRVGSLPITINVTNIVNNFIFMDDYNVRRSWRGLNGNKADRIQTAFDNFGYWFKKFGIYIKACNTKNDLIFLTPQQDTISVRVHALDKVDGNNYRRYNTSNVKILANTIVSLQGEFVGSVYMPPGYESIEEPGDYYVPDQNHLPMTITQLHIDPSTLVAGHHIIINGIFRPIDHTMDDGHVRIPYSSGKYELMIQPKPGFRNTWEAGQTYTISLRDHVGVEPLEVTIPVLTK